MAIYQRGENWYIDFTFKGQRVGESMKLSGITNFRFHDLRHTFASNLVMAGVKIEKVQKLMGHKMLTMTKRYAHLAPGYLAERVKILDRVMSQNPPQDAKVIDLNP